MGLLKQCKYCGHISDTDLEYCPECGKLYPSDVDLKDCQLCNHPVATNAVFCTNCGRIYNKRLFLWLVTATLIVFTTSLVLYFFVVYVLRPLLVLVLHPAAPHK